MVETTIRGQFDGEKLSITGLDEDGDIRMAMTNDVGDESCMYLSKKAIVALIADLAARLADQ